MEEGGLIHWIRTNDISRLILRLKTNDIPPPMQQDQRTFPFSRGQSMIYSSYPLLQQDGHRVLIFSQMVRMLDILSDYMSL